MIQRRYAVFLVATGLAAAGPAAAHAAQPATPAWMAQLADDAEALPTSRAMIAALSALAKPAIQEQALKAAGTARTTFQVAGQDFTLSASSDAVMPRRAFSATGPGVALLVKLPETTAGLAGGDSTRDARYALATVEGTRIRIWAFYSRPPSDGPLSRLMLAALAKLGPPLAMIDPAFRPPNNATGLDRYALK